MSKPITSGSFSFTPAIKASRDKVIVAMPCIEDRAMSQAWTYYRTGNALSLISVAAWDDTEIKSDPVLRGKVRRIAVKAWEQAIEVTA